METEPPVSVASANGTMPEPTAAPEPPDDPPGLRDGSKGLRVAGCAAAPVVMPNASSCRLVLPTKRAPALCSRVTTSWLCSRREPARSEEHTSELQSRG